MDSTRCSSQLGIEKNEREREVLIVSQGPGLFCSWMWCYGPWWDAEGRASVGKMGFCSECVGFWLPVGCADGDFFWTSCSVGLELRRWRLRRVGYMELSGRKWWWSHGMDEMSFRLGIPPGLVRRGRHGGVGSAGPADAGDQASVLWFSPAVPKNVGPGWEKTQLSIF